VTLTATPQTGASPLSVSFSAAGTDPEGGALDYRYSSGDQSGSASGSEVTHEYGERDLHGESHDD
jgi:hypothetical protein